MKVAGKDEQVVLKDLQRHPAKIAVMHADFMRVSATEKLHMNVPLHFINEDACPGVKAGGLVTHNINEIEVSCFPQDLPEYLEVDLSTLELDHSLHMTDIIAPAGVEIVELSHGEGHDQPIAACHMTRGSIGDEAEDAATEAEAAEGGEDTCS